jgi:DNA-binding SARP family transcriptional activator/predicted ATPase
VSRLSLYLLGPPQIELDGQPVKLDRRKAIALLAYLAVTGQSHRRDALVNLLWPESDSSRGRAALRRTLYALNQALDGEWLAVDREEIGLDPDADLWVDVLEFQRHLAECESHGHPAAQVCPACVSSLTEAVGLVRGEFLSGFSLKDSFNFDDWQLFQAEQRRRELAGALEKLVEWHSRGREFEPAAGYARRRLALDPLDEGAHRQLMRLYTWSGRRTAALRQYEECVAVLEEQLGVPPQEETVELYQAIQAGQAPPSPEEGWEGEAVEPPAETPAFLEGEVRVECPVFVAREGELAQLEGHLEATLAGQGKVVFVTGDVGSGKTALIQEFTRRAQEAHPDLVVASGNCNAYTGIGDPYLPFREILELLTGNVEARWAAGAITGDHACRLWNILPTAAQALVEAGPDLIDTFIPRAAFVKRAKACAPGGPDWLTRLSQLVERKSTGSGILSPQQSDLFEQYSKVLQALARQASLVLVLDDLQWADLGSISLLFHLGRQLARSRILIVSAYRPEEVTIGRDGERHPLEPVVNELQRLFGNITVNLAQAGGQAFLEAYLDSEPNRLGVAFRDMLYRQTRGHPLFIIELLRGLQDRGDLVQDPEGRWVEGPALDWETLPARVEAVIAERIGRLAQPLQGALRVASVEGEVFTAEVVARVRGTDEREILGCLSDELDRRHRLVRAQSIQRVDPALCVPSQVGRSGAMGSQLLSRYRFRHILFQKYLYSGLDEVERVHLHEQVGTALEELYGAREQVAEFVSTAPIAVQLALHFQRAGIPEKAIHYLRQAGERAVQLSAHQEAIAHLTRALALLTALPDSGLKDQRLQHARQELALQLSLGAAWLATSTPAPEMEQAYSRACELGQQLGKTSQLRQALGGLAIFWYIRAEHQRARELAEEMLSLAQQTEDPLLVLLSHWYRGVVLFSLGEYTAALGHLEQVIALYNPEQHHRGLVMLRGSDAGPSALGYAACCLWCLGYPEQALSRSQEALALARGLGHPFTLTDALCYAGCQFHEMRRDAEALKDHAEELVRLANETSLVGWLAEGIRFRGEALATLGQVQEGMEQIRAGMAAKRSTGARLHRSGALGSLAEVQARAGQPGEGLVTLAEALALVEETGERCVEAELHRVRAELLLMQGNEADAEASLQQAIEVARRQQARSWELRATVSLARLWQARGRTDEARQILSEVYAWFTEGFDTVDLQEARALLEELS